MVAPLLESQGNLWNHLSEGLMGVWKLNMCWERTFHEEGPARAEAPRQEYARHICTVARRPVAELKREREWRRRGDDLGIAAWIRTGWVLKAMVRPWGLYWVQEETKEGLWAGMWFYTMKDKCRRVRMEDGKWQRPGERYWCLWPRQKQWKSEVLRHWTYS